MIQYHQRSVLSPCNNFTYHMWNSFSEDQLVAVSLSTKTSSVYKTLCNATGETSVTSTLRWFSHTTLHGYFWNLIEINSRYCVYQMLISELSCSRLHLHFWLDRTEAFYNFVVLKVFQFHQTDNSQMCLALCLEQDLTGLGLTHEEKHITSSQVVS